MPSHTKSGRGLQEVMTELHDHLWVRAQPDEARLLRRLERGARDLDRHLGTGSAVYRAIRPLTREFHPAPLGADLFIFLRAVTNLSVAADHVRRGPREAAKQTSELSVSLCIHLASVADRFDVVQEFESGKTDFAQFTSKLADALEERGVLGAGEFRRAVNLAFDMNAVWETRASPDAQRIMATACVACAALACVLFEQALHSLGKYRETPYAKLVPVARRILDRLGGHP